MKPSVAKVLAVCIPAVVLLVYVLLAATTTADDGNDTDDFWYQVKNPSPSASASVPTDTPPVPSDTPSPEPTAAPSPSPTPRDQPPVDPATDTSCAAPAPVDTVAVRDEKDGLCVAIYTVKPWDYLSAIAEKYGSPLTDVYQWSLGALGPNPDPNLIYEGQPIVVKVLAKL